MAMTHHQNPFRDTKCKCQLLFDQNHTHSPLANVNDHLHNGVDDLRSKSFCRFVDHDEPGITEQRPANGQHLLFAPRQASGFRITSLD